VGDAGREAAQRGELLDMPGLAFVRDPFGDVRDKRHRQAPRFIGEVRQADLDGELGAVLASARQRQPEPHRPGTGSREVVRLMLSVDGAAAVGDQDFQASPHELLPLVAEQRLGSWVREDDLAVAIDPHDALSGAFEECANAGLAGSEFRPQLLLLRDIPGDRLKLGWLPLLLGKDLIDPQVPPDLAP
jgi:hypothetical protein